MRCSTTGSVACWGKGNVGQLGIGEKGIAATRTTPTKVLLGD